MKIAVFHNLRSSGGAKRALVEMVRQLKLHGHLVDALLPTTAEESFLPLDEVADSVRFVPVAGWALPPGTSLMGAAARLPTFARALRQAETVERLIAERIDVGGYDVCFVHHGRYTQAPWVLRYLETPSVYYCQEPMREAYEYMSEQTLRQRLRLWAPVVGWAIIDRMNMSAATSVLANSFYSRESILRAYGRDSTVVYLGVDGSQFRPGNDEREKCVLSVGALHSRKGHARVIDAVAAIPASRRPRVLIIGDRAAPGEQQQLEAHAAAAGVDLALKIGISERDLVETYRRSAVLVSAARLEPFGLVALEAAACGTPVVAVREAGLREAVSDGTTGILVDEGVPEALGEAIDGLLADPVQWRALSAGGVDWVRSNWTWARTGEMLIEALDLASRNRGNRESGVTMATAPVDEEA